MHFNSPSFLPPVDINLLIKVEDKIIEATRPSHVESKDSDLVYITKSGEEITGRFYWTYP